MNFRYIPICCFAVVLYAAIGVILARRNGEDELTVLDLLGLVWPLWKFIDGVLLICRAFALVWQALHKIMSKRNPLTGNLAKDEAALDKSATRFDWTMVIALIVVIILGFAACYFAYLANHLAKLAAQP